MNTKRNQMNDKKLPLIITSECLLGKPVRHNGGHLHQDWLTSDLAKFFEVRPICPELRMGLGVPRPAMRLVQDGDEAVRMVSTPKKDQQEKDLTDSAKSVAKIMSDELLALINDGLCGLILAKKSPSCGLERVKHYNPKSGVADKHGMGVFAYQFTKNIPGLPVIDSGRIHNLELRELFIRKAYAFYRFHQQVTDIYSLQLFHQKYKYILMEFSSHNLQMLGRIAANSDKKNFSEVFSSYRELFLETINQKSPTRAKRKNVLLHLFGYFKKDLDQSDKSYFLELMQEYEKSFTPYIALVKMIAHFTQKYQQAYLKDQYYLNPYPKELGLEKFIDSSAL